MIPYVEKDIDTDLFSFVTSFLPRLNWVTEFLMVE